MNVGDETALAETVREARVGRTLSQAELAEVAKVSAKTVQRMEAGSVVAGSSRRAVLDVLGIDHGRRPEAAAAPASSAAADWRVISTAASLIRSLDDAGSVEVELDRDGWRQDWDARPRLAFVFALKDPVDIILEIVDRVRQHEALPPGRAAKRQDELASAIRDAQKMDWALAGQVDETGRLSLYIGSPSEVGERTSQGSA